MKKFFEEYHPSFFLILFGILGGIFFWVYRDMPRWSDLERFSQKHFNTMWTLTGIALVICALMIVGGFIWLNAASGRKSK